LNDASVFRNISGKQTTSVANDHAAPRKIVRQIGSSRWLKPWDFNFSWRVFRSVFGGTRICRILMDE
jgi:hypothetical protein